jgi:hypothetical protein
MLIGASRLLRPARSASSARRASRSRGYRARSTHFPVGAPSRSRRGPLSTAAVRRCDHRSGTCSAPPRRCPGRTPPRCPYCPRVTWVSRRRPSVEIADHGGGAGVGCPDGEVCPAAVRMRAENLPQAVVRALVEQVLVLLANVFLRVGRVHGVVRDGGRNDSVSLMACESQTLMIAGKIARSRPVNVVLARAGRAPGVERS